MKKTLRILIILLLSITFGMILFLSTFGLETKYFNNLVIKKVKDFNEDIIVELDKIKIKLDLRNLSIFLVTDNSNFIFKNKNFKVNQIKAYSDIKGILKRKSFKLKKISLSLNNVNYSDLKELLIITKPSNLKSFILNNTESGIITGSYDFEISDKSKIQILRAEGYIQKLNLDLIRKINIKNSNFLYFYENNQLLLKNLQGKINDVFVSNGELNLNYQETIDLKANFTSKLNLNEKNLENIFKKKLKLKENNIGKFNLKGNLQNSINISLNEKKTISNFTYEAEGNISEGDIEFLNPFKIQFISEEFKKTNIKDSSILINISKDKKNKFALKGKYRINKNNFNNFEIENNLKKGNYFINLNINEPVFIEILNFKSDQNKPQTIKSNIKTDNSNILIKDFEYKNNDSLFEIKNLHLDKNRSLKKLEKLKVQTKQNNKLNNDFELSIKDSIIISGKKYDGQNFLSILDKERKNNPLKHINKKINIKFDEILTSILKESSIKSFNLIGKITKGAFEQFSAKGEFNDNKYLDLSLKQNKKEKRKIFEYYSDIPEPFLKNYKFFQGLQGGKMTYISSFDKSKSINQILIEDFKVKNAPGFLKLLSLADLQGLSDAAQGEGVSFDELQINFEKVNKQINLSELYAIGPSVSVLMDGYVDTKSGLISFKGNLIPAKTLNNIISKIPVIGDVVIPKEIGEGFFGISFKLKGLPGEVKTTVNPLKTITPRFIQKALKKTK